MGRMTMADLKKMGFHVGVDGTAKRFNTEKATTKPGPTENNIKISTKAIFIPGNVPSSKNSRQLFVRNGKPMSVESELCQAYRRLNSGRFFDLIPDFKRQLEGKSKPYRIEFLFARSTRRGFDHHNAIQLLMDMMTEYGWIVDDNADEAVAVPPIKPYFISKENPGVYITVL